ncbi:hypothetical protein NPIL_153561 [Nephila pilipes]|uniref:Uncharacterized protein n=1 Tax=Nephila pilipes TaxID=299642 RepID=A0A8X6NAA6_NEPPI|nr:hypothetical protein NPIL_153561 [Nephila pilipes]
MGMSLPRRHIKESWEQLFPCCSEAAGGGLLQLLESCALLLGLFLPSCQRNPSPRAAPGEASGTLLPGPSPGKPVETPATAPPHRKSLRHLLAWPPRSNNPREGGHWVVVKRSRDSRGPLKVLKCRLSCSIHVL